MALPGDNSGDSEHEWGFKRLDIRAGAIHGVTTNISAGSNLQSRSCDRSFQCETILRINADLFVVTSIS